LAPLFTLLTRLVCTATTDTAMSGSCFWELRFVALEHPSYGQVKLLLLLDIQKQRSEEGEMKPYAEIIIRPRLTEYRYVGIWMGIRQMGPLVGGAISLALNIKTSEKGKVTYTTYLGLVAISSLGAPLALLLSQPQQVVRSDGTQIPYMKKTNFGIEARAIWKQLRNKYMLLLIPVFLAGQFGVTYQGNYLTSE
jgi:hypothetical protein